MIKRNLRKLLNINKFRELQFPNTLSLPELQAKPLTKQYRRISDIEAHMFWAYGNLSKLETICIRSFIKNGYILNLWTYGNITNAPNGAAIRDAREVIPENRVFTYKNGSYAGFANLFRYAILSTIGGLWADTDVICLTPAVDLLGIGDDGFIVTERTEYSDVIINNNLIYNPAPKRGDIIDLSFAFSDRFDIDKLEWGYCGPKLLTIIAQTYPLLAPNIMEPNFANPVDYWNCPKTLLMPNATLHNRSQFLHCYNETWRRGGVDKNADYPPGSIMAKMEQKFL